jgi:hypothetical protein
LRAIGEHTGANRIENFHRQANGISSSFQHERQHRADQNGLGYTLGAVPADVLNPCQPDSKSLFVAVLQRAAGGEPGDPQGRRTPS